MKTVACMLLGIALIAPGFLEATQDTPEIVEWHFLDDDCPEVLAAAAELNLAKVNTEGPTGSQTWLAWLEQLRIYGGMEKIFNLTLAKRLQALPSETKQAILEAITATFAETRKLYKPKEAMLPPRRSVDFVLGAVVDAHSLISAALANGATAKEAYASYLAAMQRGVGRPDFYSVDSVFEAAKVVQENLRWTTDLAVRLDTYQRTLCAYYEVPWRNRWWQRTEPPRPEVDDSRGTAHTDYEVRHFDTIAAAAKRMRHLERVEFGRAEVIMTGSFPNGRAVFEGRSPEKLHHGSDIDIWIQAKWPLARLMTLKGSLQAEIRDNQAAQTGFLSRIPFSQAFGHPIGTGDTHGETWHTTNGNHALYIARHLSPVNLLVSREDIRLIVFPTGEEVKPLDLKLCF